MHVVFGVILKYIYSRYINIYRERPFFYILEKTEMVIMVITGGKGEVILCYGDDGY